MFWIFCDEEKWRSGVKPFEAGGNVAHFLAVHAARLGGPLMLRCSQDPCCSGSNQRTALCLLALLVTRSGVCCGTLLGSLCPHSPAGQNLPLWDWVDFELKLSVCGWMSHVQSWAPCQGVESSSSVPEITRFWSCPSRVDVGLQLWQSVEAWGFPVRAWGPGRRETEIKLKLTFWKVDCCVF